MDRNGCVVVSGARSDASRARCRGENWRYSRQRNERKRNAGDDDAHEGRRFFSSRLPPLRRPCYLSLVPCAGARHAALSSLSRARLLWEGAHGAKEREKESGISRTTSFSMPTVEKMEREKTHFLFFIGQASRSMLLARRAGSYFSSFRVMGASQSTVSTSVATEAANNAAVGGGEARATTETTMPSTTTATPSTSSSTSTTTSQPAGAKKASLISPPAEPGPEDCCQSGCAECVWEVYYRERREYERALAEQEGGGGGGDEPADAAATAAASPPPPPLLDAFAAVEAKIAAQEAEKKKKKASEAKS